MSWRECALWRHESVAWMLPTSFNYRGGIGGLRTIAWPRRLKQAKGLPLPPFAASYLTAAAVSASQTGM